MTPQRYSAPLVVFALLLLPTAVARGDQMVVYVPGTSDPWLAGMPAGSTASAHPSNPSSSPDVAPTHSPVLVSGALVTPGAELSFGVTGTSAYGPAPASGPDTRKSGPDGQLYDGKFIHHLIGAQNGLSDVVTPINGLLGVFLNGNAPNGSPAPRGLDFRPSGATGVTSPATLNGGLLDAVVGGTGYSALSPGLGQVFFIGDGLDGMGGQQKVTVPAGATRLFLGTADGWNWADNREGFTVRVSSTGDGSGGPVSAPEPGALTLAGLGALGGLIAARRRLR